MGIAVVRKAHTIPCPWDGTIEGLGDGLDSMFVAAFDAHDAHRKPAALGAVSAEIRPRFQGQGLAGRVLDAMAELARGARLGHLIAPVRPRFKDRYPITPYWEPNVWIVHEL